MKIFILFSFFISFSSFAKPCGLQGSVDDRIKDCSQVKGRFSLVAMTENGLEIYKDTQTGLIWGPRILSDFNHYGSNMACSEEVSGYLNIGALKWRLPTIQEFESAYSNGMKSALSNSEHTYWSSTPVRSRKVRRRRSTQPSQVYLWDGKEERSDTGDLKDAASVRCVTRD